MGSAKKASDKLFHDKWDRSFYLGAVNPVLGGWSLMQPDDLAGKKGGGPKPPAPPDLTKSYLQELAKMGIQRQLLRSSGRGGAFAGFNARQRPTSPNPSGALGG